MVEYVYRNRPPNLSQVPPRFPPRYPSCYLTFPPSRLSRYFPHHDDDDPSSDEPLPFHSVIYRHSDVAHPALGNNAAGSTAPPCKSMKLEESDSKRRNSNATKLEDYPDKASFTDETGSVIPTPLSNHRARSKRQVGAAAVMTTRI